MRKEMRRMRKRNEGERERKGEERMITPNVNIIFVITVSYSKQLLLYLIALC
jgi:hypothetical protein